MIHRSALPLLAALLPGMLHAQSIPDTVLLRQAEVTATRQSLFGAGMKVQHVDSVTLERYRAASLADLLATATPVFVKSYGLGGLATTSMRGGSANHTAVLWNGFNIGSPMNGMIDLSLVPVFAADAVSLQYGGSSALWGSGAVGGTIQLSTAPAFNEGTLVDGSLAFGSFGDRRQQARVRMGGARWAGSIGLYNATAINNFDVMSTGSPEGPIQQQQNADFKQHGLLAEVHGRITDRQRVSLRYWGQESDRSIPPTMLQEQSTARQTDASHRITAEWQHNGDHTVWMARAAWFDEALDWYAWRTASAALNRSHTAIMEAEARIPLGRGHALNVGVNNTWAEAVSDGYPQGPHQNRSALYAAYRLSHAERWNVSLSLRQEALDGEVMPFTASLGAEYQLLHGLRLKANAAKVYCVPTFNDLYWRTEGNPDLRAEDGYSGDLGVAWTGDRGRFGWRTEITGFSRLIDDRIIWLPGPVYWTPRNVEQVWSRGVESDTELRIRVRSTTVKLGMITNYVVSTNQEATSPNDSSVDKQLIYIPMYTGGARIGVEWKGLGLLCSANYTGYRYTSTDNSDFLDPYTLVNAALSYRFGTGGRYSWSAFVHGNNLLNTDYQVMLNRPMPLRNFQVGVSIHFHRPVSSRTEGP